ncbi:Hypothetical predicted protein [Paramuricea clavata]|uniref:Reverse transcriptase domain-containing protein n=1 Tax=Paramuricea clavata TaxID=317549 RepID=A0A7D9LT26_PARCT|nr:Hypothetical predicted protein [Paramuricea clavata]
MHIVIRLIINPDPKWEQAEQQYISRNNDTYQLQQQSHQPHHDQQQPPQQQPYNDTSLPKQHHHHPKKHAGEGDSILGDSLTRGINTRNIRRSTSKNVIIRTFPGATVMDMVDHIKPSLRLQPAHIIIHVGTNDLKPSEEDNVIKSGVLDIGMSDHLPIFISRKINSRISIKQGLHTISYRRKKDFIASDFGNDLVEEIPLSLYEIFDDPNNLLDCWYSHFMTILDRHAPLIKHKVRNNKLPGWFNSESKEDYYKNLLTDNVHNPRQLWKILKDILPTNDTVSPITLNINGKEISDPIEVGALFNEYFSSIADNFDISLLNNPINTHLPIATNHIKFTIPLITIDDILNLAAELDQNKSTGLDGIPAYFIKSSIHSIAPIIFRICNMSIENGIFPNMWKKARLIPIYKAETPFDLVDHRLLLQKLEQYGITPIALKWFKSYLNDRYQVVQIASSLSNPALIKSGVPQGSILGPILFLIFINDLPSYVGSSKPFLFADDSTLISSGSDLHELSVSKVRYDLSVPLD